MPRPNGARTLASEANLARRIAYERAQRGLSYEALATLMTDVGCGIQGSAIFKIEKGDPPRRVTVDELVALSTVLDVEITELLLPMELLEKRRAQQLLQRLDDMATQLTETAELMFNTYAEYFGIAVENPELREFVDNQYFDVTEPDLKPLAMFARLEIGGEEGDADEELSGRLAVVLQNFVSGIIGAAGVAVGQQPDQRARKKKR